MIFKRWHALVIWLAGTLIAIALVGDFIYLGLAIAIASGVIFGIVNFLSYQNTK
jgi:hypothetical protein